MLLETCRYIIYNNLSVYDKNNDNYINNSYIFLFAINLLYIYNSIIHIKYISLPVKYNVFVIYVVVSFYFLISIVTNIIFILYMFWNNEKFDFNIDFGFDSKYKLDFHLNNINIRKTLAVSLFLFFLSCCII